MRIEGTFLGSVVGRRLFGLVAFVTTVPIAVLAALTYHEMSGILQRRAALELAAYAKSGGMDVVKRLQAAQDRLASYDAVAAVGRSLKESGLAPMFQAVSIERASPAGRAAPAPDGIGRLRFDRRRDELTLSLVVEPSAVAASAQLRAGVLDLAYLFGDPESLPARTQICVLSGPDRAIVYCSDPRLAGVAAGIAAADRDPVTQSGLAAGRWTLSSAADLDFAPLTFVAMHPVDPATMAEGGVALTYLKVAAAFLVLALLLSLTQIRRILVPLERLTEATRRVAAWDFSKPVPVDSADEFGTLATSFNAMASDLDSQIGALRIMTAIDQDILSHRDVDCVIGRVLVRIGQLLPGATAIIARFHAHSPEGAPIILWRSPATGDGGGEARADRGEMPCRLLRSRLSPGSDTRVLLPAGDPLGAELLPGTRRASLLVPAWTPAGACTVIAIGLAQAREPDAPARGQLQELAKRIGVAFDAAEWQTRLMQEARSDSLTALPNRLRIHELIEERLGPGPASQFALLFIDLDRFKGVNDGLGHDAGDSLLVQAARRLRDRVGPRDIVARLGGDEFIVLSDAVADPAPADLAAGLIAAISEPYRIGHSLVHVSASIGIVVSPDDGRNREELIRNADTALYQAKGQGRGRAVRFEDNMRRAAVENLSLEEDLRAALGREEIRVNFQPRVRLLDGSLAGAEALARWSHPVRGAVSPLLFVEMSEDLGLVGQLGDSILRQVCEFQVGQRRSGVPLVPLSINLSGVQLRDPDLGKRLRHTIGSYGLRPADIELEITETVLVQDLDSSARTLQALRSEGFRIALDDFGTGYSSLSYLKNLPIDVMKIDRSFVHDIATSPGSRAIAVAIVGIAHTLGMRVVAEGIETLEQAELLRQWGCEEGQGYLFARPMPPPEFGRYVMNATAADAIEA